MISIVCYFFLFPVVFAFNVSIYTGKAYYSTTHPEPERLVEEKYGFVYHLNRALMMDIVLKNKSPDVTAAVYATSRSITNETYGDTVTKNMTTKCKDEDCLRLYRIILKSQFISIGMQLNRGIAPCATLIISEGMATSTSQREDLCVGPRNCVMVIDLLQNECGKDIPDPQEHVPPTWSPSQNNVTKYVISSVVVMCLSVILLGIYLSVKKFWNRSSNPEETLELNTYATTNEVLYADLSFVQGNNQPPRNEEESPYAQIIGVLHPKK